MTPESFLLLALLIFSLAGGLATILGWGLWVHLARNLKAAHLKKQRARLHPPVPVRVPPVVRSRAPGLVAPRPGPVSKPKPAAPAPSLSAGATYSASPLLTKGERCFYVALQHAVAGRFHITLKPRLADLVRVREGRGFYRAFNQVAMKHIDFVLMDPTTMVVVLLLELDDRTHRQWRRRQRDQLVNEVCREAGLQIMHITARASYSPQIIQSFIDDRLARTRQVG